MMSNYHPTRRTECGTTILHLPMAIMKTICMVLLQEPRTLILTAQSQVVTSHRTSMEDPMCPLGIQPYCHITQMIIANDLNSEFLRMQLPSKIPLHNSKYHDALFKYKPTEELLIYNPLEDADLNDSNAYSIAPWQSVGTDRVSILHACHRQPAKPRHRGDRCPSQRINWLQ